MIGPDRRLPGLSWFIFVDPVMRLFWRVRHCASQRKGWLGLITTPLMMLLLSGAAAGQAEQREAVDRALLLAVDVSDSVDADRYRLQIEGIARALTDPEVIDAMLSGPHRGVAIALVAWSDHAEMVLPWQIVRNGDNARQVAGLVRRLPQISGEYTCLARMMSAVNDSLLASIPAQPTRVILDISGDGIDNCAEPAETDASRDALVARGVTINGLPILVDGENDVVGAGAYRAPGFGLRPLFPSPDSGTTLDRWFIDHVIGGPAAFVHPAMSYDDFGRAFRQKLIAELSASIE
jgi:hypothetical protein